MTHTSMRRKYIKSQARKHLSKNVLPLICATLPVYFSCTGLLCLLDMMYSFFSQYATELECGVLFLVFAFLFLLLIFPLLCGYSRFLYLSYTEKSKDVSTVLYYFEKEKLILCLKFFIILIFKGSLVYIPVSFAVLFLQKLAENEAHIQFLSEKLGVFSSHFLPAVYCVLAFALLCCLGIFCFRFLLASFIFSFSEDAKNTKVFSRTRQMIRKRRLEIALFYLSFAPYITICTLCAGTFFIPVILPYFNIANTVFLYYFQAFGSEKQKCEKLAS